MKTGETERNEREGLNDFFFFFEEIKVRSEKKRGVRDPMAEVACLISQLFSPESALTASSSSFCLFLLL